MNPFTNRGVITNEADFIGREEQIGEIIERLRTLQSSSLVGERRIGKSSLLYHLAQPGARRIEDEFEITFEHRDQFPEELFDHMPSLLNIRTLAFVTASRKTLRGENDWL